MQQQTRYYITKSGDESTVRSVRVARAADGPVDSPNSESTTQSALTPVAHVQERRTSGFKVKDLLPGAIRKRVFAL